MSAPAEPNPPAKGHFLVYQTDDGQIKIDVRLQGETAWLTQAHMAELFQTTVPNVSMHLRNIYAEGEFQPAATVQEFLTVRQEGTRTVPSPIAASLVRSANGAISYQPGATPKVCVHSLYQGPTARAIPATIRPSTYHLALLMGRAFSPRFVFPSVPGALPQAGMAAHLWCSRAGHHLEQTIAGNVAEILEA